MDNVSLSVSAGRTLSVVGESGSGKTMTFLSALGIAPPAGHGSPQARHCLLARIFLPVHRSNSALRGTAVSMVFQDPLTALNPVFTVGSQISEVLRAHLPVGPREARERAVALLERVHIPSPARRLDDYPHQFSGGMRQRVLIAMAIALGPRVLIADEPTTALDVTVQAQILELLTQLREESGMALVLITHDLGLVARHADEVAVFYAGRIVERAAVDPLFTEPRHPYTTSLFRSIQRLDETPGTKLTPISGQPPNLTNLPGAHSPPVATCAPKIVRCVAPNSSRHLIRTTSPPVCIGNACRATGGCHEPISQGTAAGLEDISKEFGGKRTRRAGGRPCSADAQAR